MPSIAQAAAEGKGVPDLAGSRSGATQACQTFGRPCRPPSIALAAAESEGAPDLAGSRSGAAQAR